MKISNLKKGMVIKNYKELCKILGIKSTGGNTKKKHLKELERHIKYHKQGHKFIIDEIYDKPLCKIDNRGKNPRSHNNQRGAYGKYIRLLILNMLSKNEYLNKDNVIKIGKNMMLFKLNMINDNYRYGNYNRKKLANYLNMDLKFIDEFFSTSTKKLRYAVETTLDNLMKNEKLIFWNNIKMIRINDIHREATDKEIEFITNCESKTLQEMNVKNIEQIYASNRIIEYYKRVNRKLQKKNIYYAYNAYKIIFADTVYERNEQLKYKLEIDDEIENKNELNNTVCFQLNDSAIKRHQKNKKEFEIKSSSIPNSLLLRDESEYKQIILDKNFIKNNKKLIDVCIDANYDNICELCGIAWEYKHKLKKQSQNKQKMK